VTGLPKNLLLAASAMSASEKKSSVQIGYVCGLALPKLDKGLQEPNTKQLSSNFKAVY
jgi:hypothetical protein